MLSWSVRKGRLVVLVSTQDVEKGASGVGTSYELHSSLNF